MSDRFRNPRRRRLPLAIAALLATATLVVGCGDDGDDASGATDDTSSATDTQQQGDSEGSGPVTQDEAEAAALEAVGEGTVTWSGPEDDRGAAWEIEVTRDDGSEVDLLVAPDGTIVN